MSLLESVRCLECGAVYAKPSGGGTVADNPGCPECAYVGWIPVSLPRERRPSAAVRFVSRPQPVLLARTS